ncbi:molecular chaperone [Listeria booriae]|uniref:molecular chaperone n=1 Tax=Listeria booriae TaxID=1552123 RepID=UPI0016267967|nr:molecular chaperone [Listeria booriae]MBC2098127.1 molecular chaperone [Listeria booriae]
MVNYQSSLADRQKSKQQQKYTRKQLERLTTLQLRDICYREKLVKGIANSLDRLAFIETILKFRGANEDYLIKIYNAAGFERLAQLVQKNLGEPLFSKSPIHNPAKLTIYSGLAIEKRDEYKVITSDSLVLESNVLLVDENKKLCAIFYLLPTEAEDSFYLCMEKGMHHALSNQKNYKLLYFGQRESEYLFDVYMENEQNLQIPLDYYETEMPNVIVQSLVETKTTLAIDFGTSNTTVGAYLTDDYLPVVPEHDVLHNHIRLNDINLVTFLNTEGVRDVIVPTVIGIADCENPDELIYEYGYTALRDATYMSGSQINSVFYGLKRWIHSYDEQEEVIDYAGNLTMVQRGEIIRQYLLFLIRQAEQQLKCQIKKLHISSPVKLKQQHLMMFRELLPEYDLEMSDALDEGVAVLYNTIANQIEKNHFEEGIPYQALIIDCGGGTTDLSSCQFEIKDTQLTYQVAIQTTFENGDTNFGGNNLTYRIMQYLKILFVDYYKNGKRTNHLEDILQVMVNDVYRFVDKNGVEALYSSLQTKYEEAEIMLPTMYQQYRHQSYSDYQKIRGNYYTLWRIAEEIKQSFYHKTGVSRIGLNVESGPDLDHYILKNQSFRLALRKNEQLEFVYEIPGLVLNLEEINGVLKGDIYRIIKSFLEAFYIDNSLQAYSIIKMTGQSCRIELFRDAIKEFVAGRSIEFRQKDNDVKDLKLSCLFGAIRYLQDRKTGKIQAKIEHAVPMTPYRIYGLTHHQKEITLIAGNEKLTQTHGHISRHSQVEEMMFYLQSETGEVKSKYCYSNDRDSYEAITYEEINSAYTKHIPQEAVDIILDGEVKFFVYAEESQWGFYVLPISRELGKLYMCKPIFYPFENENWEMNFFDGTY